MKQLFIQKQNKKTKQNQKKAISVSPIVTEKQILVVDNPKIIIKKNTREKSFTQEKVKDKEGEKAWKYGRGG